MLYCAAGEKSLNNAVDIITKAFKLKHGLNEYAVKLETGELDMCFRVHLSISDSLSL